jgi:hypothetical protein
MMAIVLDMVGFNAKYLQSINNGSSNNPNLQLTLETSHSFTKFFKLFRKVSQKYCPKVSILPRLDYCDSDHVPFIDWWVKCWLVTDWRFINTVEFLVFLLRVKTETITRIIIHLQTLWISAYLALESWCCGCVLQPFYTWCFIDQLLIQNNTLTGLTNKHQITFVKIELFVCVKCKAIFSKAFLLHSRFLLCFVACHVLVALSHNSLKHHGILKQWCVAKSMIVCQQLSLFLEVFPSSN